MFNRMIIFAALVAVALCQGITAPPRPPSVCEVPMKLGCNAANYDHGCCAECIGKVMDDFKIIQMKKTDANGDPITYGHPSLNNCLFCAGQCWDNALDNTHCQVSMTDPFGDEDFANKKKRSMMSDDEVHQMLMDIHEGKRSIESACNPSHREFLKVFIPGKDGPRWHLGAGGILQDGSMAPTPKPTYHESAVNAPVEPTPQPTFADVTPAPPTVAESSDDNQGNQDGGQQGVVKTAPKTQAKDKQMGNGMPKDGELCGMDGEKKLFWYCGVCGGDVNMVCDTASHSMAVSTAALFGAAAVAAVAGLRQ